jgi:hypothetical protein
MQAPRHILADHHANEPPPAYTGLVVTVAPCVAESTETDRKRHYKKLLHGWFEANYQSHTRGLYERQEIQ